MTTTAPRDWVATGLQLDEIDFSEIPMRIDTDRYTSLEFQEREREQIWTKTWQAVCREDEIADVGDWVTHTIFDQSFIVVRGRDRRIRGFVNACRHRGNQLCQGRGHSQRFVCQYHVWTYDLDGALKGFARPELVGDLVDRMDELGLLEVPVDTFAGFVFMNPDPEAPSLADHLGPEIIEFLTPYHLEELTTVMNVRESLRCNWKVVVDAFQEGYHIQGVHPELLRIIQIDPHSSRHIFPADHQIACSPFDVAQAGVGPQAQVEGINELPGTFPGVAEILPRFNEIIDEHRAADGTIELPEGTTPRHVLQWATREVLTAKGLDVSGLTDAQMSDNHGYLLFPNFFMTIRAGEATVILMAPDPGGDPNRCYWHIMSFYYLPEGELRDAFRVELTEVTENGTYPYFLALQQDYDQMQRQQDGLRNRRMKEMMLVPEEVNVANFHKNVDRYCARAGS